MSAAILSTPPPQYISVSGTTRGRNMTPISPSCRAAHYSTPPRFSADPSSAPSYDSPMLTPSPLRRQHFFAPPVDDPEQDDIFLQSPFKSPPPVHRLYSHRVHKQPVPIDDDDGSIFLSPSTSPFFPVPSSQPLRTPVKEELRSKTRSVLKSRLNAQSVVASTSAVASAAVGTKRKSSAQSGSFSTPLRQSVPTPLSISAAKADPASGVAFHRLAPLAAPRFGDRTPQSKAETEAYLKGQAETMKRLRIRDMENSDEDWGVIEDAGSACEAEERNNAGAKKTFSNKLPLLSRRSKNQLRSPRKPLTIKAVPQKGSTLDEVTEAISPGGHILKRRARSRPVSLELLESVNQISSPSAPSQVRFAVSLRVRCAKACPLIYSLTHQVLSIDVHQSRHLSLFRQSIAIGCPLSTMSLPRHQAAPQYHADGLPVVVDHILSCRRMYPILRLAHL